MQIRYTHKLSIHVFKFLNFSFFRFILHYKYPNNLFQLKTSYTEALYKAGERFQICSVFFIHPVVCRLFYLQRKQDRY